MNILIVGSGGREHALAWKIRQSPRVDQLWVAPGNAGTAQLGKNVAIRAEDVPGLVAFAQSQAVDLVIVGPEAALAVGLADALRKAGIRVFGPSQAAAQIECSKAFAKAFMQRHALPTARYATFTCYEDARRYLDEVDFPIVIKTSGLAAGKGVILPETAEEAQSALHAMMIEHAFGAAGDAVVIEERLSGEEVSLLAFTDGATVRPMPPAQDHKRLQDDDQGLNTGGMGAYAPAPICPPELVEKVTREILQPAVDGLRAEGIPFVGVLYAGLMLTPQGPKVLEFNCRFGDPETQVLLPLLESDLLDIVEACVEGRLDQVMPRWQNGVAVTVVLASPGYPEHPWTGYPIQGLDCVPERNLIFHAGTKLENGQVLTAGGRVLNVTSCGPALENALASVYEAIPMIHFEGMQYRHDIARKAFRSAGASSAYAASGVSIDAGNRAVELMKDAVRSTYTPSVLAGIGAFGGLFDISSLVATRNLTLVASTDGVGTKVRLAALCEQYESLGQDIVNHCINDILVQGARPLFFLDYFATARLDPQIVARVVSGIATACREAGCAILGGETAEMPGVYNCGEFDIAGTIVGYVERERIMPRADLQAGDVLVGLASSGPHTNGYSLIRKVFETTPMDTVFPELGIPLADALLAPHRSYLPLLSPILQQTPGIVKALAHITGGGFIENIPRVLPDWLCARITKKNWPVPPLFRMIERQGAVNPEEMYRIFNMGIGMVAVIAPDQVVHFQASIPEPTWIIGELAAGQKGVQLQ